MDKYIKISDNLNEVSEDDKLKYYQSLYLKQGVKINDNYTSPCKVCKFKDTNYCDGFCDCPLEPKIVLKSFVIFTSLIKPIIAYINPLKVRYIRF